MTTIPVAPMSLGSCCICETEMGVVNIITLDRRCPTPGRGWGCVVCGLPSDGAIAVLCDECIGHYQNGERLKYVCSGYPAEDGRTPFLELSAEVFEHDESKHQGEI